MPRKRLIEQRCEPTAFEVHTVVEWMANHPGEWVFVERWAKPWRIRKTFQIFKEYSEGYRLSCRLHYPDGTQFHRYKDERLLFHGSMRLIEE